MIEMFCLTLQKWLEQFKRALSCSRSTEGGSFMQTTIACTSIFASLDSIGTKISTNNEQGTPEPLYLALHWNESLPKNYKAPVIYQENAPVECTISEKITNRLPECETECHQIL